MTYRPSESENNAGIAGANQVGDALCKRIDKQMMKIAEGEQMEELYCPDCGNRMAKKGKGLSGHNIIQKYICTKCGCQKKPIDKPDKPKGCPRPY